MAELLTVDDHGLFCPPAGVYLDPWRPRSDVPALITHAHADHARSGAARYHAAAAGAPLLRLRLGSVDLREHAWGRPFVVNPGGDEPVEVTFFPAGHVLGSAQIRLRASGYPVTVVTGDFKRDPDPSCRPFEPVTCDTLVMEATFALPVYRWEPTGAVIADLVSWWRARTDRACMVFTYALGKAQRLMMELAVHAAAHGDLPGPIFCHGAVAAVNRAYEEAGVGLPVWDAVGRQRGDELAGALVIAPPSAHRSPWMKRMRHPATAFASGWMSVRGARRRRGYERGFVLSDHADWDGLVRTVRESGARQVYTTHGQNDVLARYLVEQEGVAARPLATLYGGQEPDAISDEAEIDD